MTRTSGCPRRGTNKLQVYVLAGVACVCMALTALAVVFRIILRRRRRAPADTVTRLHELDIGIDSPPAGWAHDDEKRVRVGSPFLLSYRRENPEAYLAFGASEAPKGRSPRPSDMRTELYLGIPNLFDLSTVDRKPPAASSWLGDPISPNEPYSNGFTFRAQGDGLIWKGEAYTVAHKGFAYYWMSWCLESEYEGLERRFRQVSRQVQTPRIAQQLDGNAVRA